MKIFLTGATGFIGQALTKNMLSRGWQVTALVRKPDAPEAQALATMGAYCVTGDITDRESMRAHMNGLDAVIHNAGWYEVGISRSARKSMHAINVMGTENVLSLAMELGIPRTIHVSTYGCFGDTGTEIRDETYRPPSTSFPTYYEQTKYEAHEIALGYQQRGLPLIIVCPAHVVGPNDHSPYGYFQRLHVNGLMPPFGWGAETVHSPVHVMDLAEGIALAVEKGRPGETYLLAGEPTSIRRIFEIWGTQPGGMRLSFYVPLWLAALMVAPAEPMQRWLGLPAVLSREAVWSTSGSRGFTSAKAERELGWSARSAEEIWVSTLQEEHKLKTARGNADLISRLKPMSETGVVQ